MNLLTKMQENVDQLWQKVIYAKTEEERQKLRTEYFRALDQYKKQCEFADGLDSPEPPKVEAKNAVSAKPRATEPAKSSPKNRVAEPARATTSGGLSPFDFPDYVDFLMGYLNSKKEAEPNIITELTKAMGVTRDAFGKILRRERKVDTKEHHKILKYMNLPALESEFIDVLFLLSTSDSGLERTKAMEKLSQFAQFKKKNPEGYEVWRYLTHWYYPAIREMATLPGFKPDPFWIQNRLVKFVTAIEIRKCLNFLTVTGFITIEGNGKVVSRHKHINCTGGLYRLALRNFHKEMLEIASSSITSLSSDKRMLLAHTVAVPESKKEQLFQILAETIEKVQALGAGEHSEDDIFHVELAAVPLTQKKDAI
ncbi:MAG: DUF4423 domain-containing protein [Pseudobdellovibrio sp.]